MAWLSASQCYCCRPRLCRRGRRAATLHSRFTYTLLRACRCRRWMLPRFMATGDEFLMGKPEMQSFRPRLLVKYRCCYRTSDYAAGHRASRIEWPLFEVDVGWLLSASHEVYQTKKKIKGEERREGGRQHGRLNKIYNECIYSKRYIYKEGMKVRSIYEGAIYENYMSHEGQ